MATCFSLLVFPLVSPLVAVASAQGIPGWVSILSKQVFRLESLYPGQLGLYVKDLESGQEFSLRGEESWYIASGVKVPIALEVLRQLDEGGVSLDTSVRVYSRDYLDGGGDTNQQSSGSLLTVSYLLRQMLVHSDNTASDLLIKLVGLERINQHVKTWARAGFSPITTLSEVRRQAYGALHPNAMYLTNRDFILLKSIHDERKKLTTLARLLGIKSNELRYHELGAAYAAYYGKELNSATLRAYGQLLEDAFVGRIVGPSSTQLLMKTLSEVQTGKVRIKAGLPASFVFAHKTGTQYGRVCDFGVAWDGRKLESKRVVIVACSRHVLSLRRAEAALKSLGNAVYVSGVFSP